MEGEPCGETMAVESIEWPFLKAQRQGGDPSVGGAGDDPSADSNSSNYEIVVSNFDSETGGASGSAPGGGSVNSSSSGGGGALDGCLDIAGLSSNGPTVDQIKIETFRVDGDDPSGGGGAVGGGGVHYSFDSDIAGLSSTLIPDPNDDQKLIRVYQTAMEGGGSDKLITVYEIKPDLDAALPASARDVLVEIVPEENLLSSVGGEQHHLHRKILTNEELQVQLGQSVPLPPEELAAVTNSAAHTVNNPPTEGSLAELRCTLCGFVSYSREEIATHCEEAHELFLCQACNLVFKKRASLQSHARAKHNNHSVASYQGSVAGGSGDRAPPPQQQQQRSKTSSSVERTLKKAKSNIVLSPFSLPQKLKLLPDVKDILAKNKAVLPNLTSAQSKKKKLVHQHQQHQHQHQQKVKRVSSQSLVLDSRLSDPQTRNQFNSEFAKKITSTGVGPEIFGMAQERLPSPKGMYRLEIKERAAECGDRTTTPIANLPTELSNGEPSSNGREMIYSYDIIDTGIGRESACKVICGICSFSNARIENVLFHCEIDHKQYYCQNRRCQLGFSSWDGLTRHMKHNHKKEK